MVKYQTTFLGIQKFLGRLLKQEQESVIKKYKILFITGMFFLLAIDSFAQRVIPDSIYYFVPAVVKSKILEHTKSLKSTYPVYGVLSHQNDTTQLIISQYGDSPKELVWLIKNCNRYIKLNSRECIPILLSEDFLFSSLLHSVNNEGDPYAVFTHRLISVSGYLIYYQGLYNKVKIIKAEFYQQ